MLNKNFIKTITYKGRRIRKKSHKLEEECYPTSVTDKMKRVYSPRVELAKQIGKEIMWNEVEAQLNRLGSMGPMNEEEQHRMVEWMEGAQRKMI